MCSRKPPTCELRTVQEPCGTRRMRWTQPGFGAGARTRRHVITLDQNSWLHCYSWDRYLSAARSHHDGEGESARWDPRGAGERDVYYWWGRFIEATFRHSLGPGAVCGVALRWEREGVGEPIFPPLFRGGRPGASSLSLTLRQCLGLPS